MVKLQVGTVRKRYLNNKRVYEYRRVSLNVPRQFHSMIEPFIGKELKMELNAKQDAITITLNTTKKIS